MNVLRYLRELTVTDIPIGKCGDAAYIHGIKQCAT